MIYCSEIHLPSDKKRSVYGVDKFIIIIKNITTYNNLMHREELSIIGARVHK